MTGMRPPPMRHSPEARRVHVVSPIHPRPNSGQWSRGATALFVHDHSVSDGQLRLGSRASSRASSRRLIYPLTPTGRSHDAASKARREKLIQEMVSARSEVIRAGLDSEADGEAMARAAEELAAEALSELDANDFPLSRPNTALTDWTAASTTSSLRASMEAADEEPVDGVRPRGAEAGYEEVTDGADAADDAGAANEEAVMGAAHMERGAAMEEAAVMEGGSVTVEAVDVVPPGSADLTANVDAAGAGDAADAGDVADANVSVEPYKPPTAWMRGVQKTALLRTGFEVDDGADLEEIKGGGQRARDGALLFAPAPLKRAGLVVTAVT